jgi:hypothetical protein
MDFSRQLEYCTGVAPFGLSNLFVAFSETKGYNMGFSLSAVLSQT